MNLSDIVLAVIAGDDTEAAIATKLAISADVGAPLHEHISALCELGTLYRKPDGRLAVSAPVDPTYPTPGSAIPGQPGYVVAACGHRIAASEWRAGFRTCERD